MIRVAPLSMAACIGPSSTLSIASDQSFATIPAVCRLTPSTPANGPSPTATTKIMAKISVSVPRRALRMTRTTCWENTFRLMLRAASRHSGNAMVQPSDVPTNAIAKVSAAR